VLSFRPHLGPDRVKGKAIPIRMKTRRAALAFVALCLVFSASAPAQINDAMVDKYYNEFNALDGTALVNASIELSMEVPLNSQSELFADLIDRAAKNPKDFPVITETITLIYNRGSRLLWNAHLEKALLAQIRHPAPQVRMMLVGLLARKEPDKYREISLSFLNDPDDDVRGRALDAMRGWKDREDILKKYIKDHAADPDHAKSVDDAKRLLEVLKDTHSTLMYKEHCGLISPAWIEITLSGYKIGDDEQPLLEELSLSSAPKTDVPNLPVRESMTIYYLPCGNIQISTRSTGNGREILSGDPFFLRDSTPIKERLKKASQSWNDYVQQLGR
jgi:hypothetical protein